jgi:hypothetical protein
MDPVAWFLDIPPNPRSPSKPSFLKKRSSIRPSGVQQKLSRTTSCNPPVKNSKPIFRSVSWSAHAEIFIIPARERLPNDRDARFKATAGRCAPNDCDLILERISRDRQPSRSVSWGAQVEVFIIPARGRAPDDCCDQRLSIRSNMEALPSESSVVLRDALEDKLDSCDDVIAGQTR